MEAPLPTSSKLLAWFAIANGLLTAAAPFSLSVWGGSTPPAVIAALLVALGAFNVVAGFFGLRAKAWAFWLLFGLFLIQSAEYFSQPLVISFIGPLSLKFGWGWYSPPSHFNLNILAIVVCYFAARAADKLSPTAGEGDGNASSGSPAA